MFLAVFVQLSTCDLASIRASPGDGESIVISFKLIDGAFDGEIPSFVQFHSIFSWIGDYFLLARKVCFWMISWF